MSKKCFAVFLPAYGGRDLEKVVAQDQRNANLGSNTGELYESALVDVLVRQFRSLGL